MPKNLLQKVLMRLKNSPKILLSGEIELAEVYEQCFYVSVFLC